jgi:hypothetical protein
MASLTQLKKKKRRRMISRKISKVAHDSPGLTHKQVLGKAFGILRHRGKIR